MFQFGKYTGKSFWGHGLSWDQMIRYEVTPTNILIQMISGDYRIKGKQKVRQNKDNDLYTQSSENSIHFQTSLFVRQQVEPLEENVAFISSSGRHEPRAVESGLQLDKVIDSQCWLLSPLRALIFSDVPSWQNPTWRATGSPGTPGQTSPQTSEHSSKTSRRLQWAPARNDGFHDTDSSW